MNILFVMLMTDSSEAEKQTITDNSFHKAFH